MTDAGTKTANALQNAQSKIPGLTLEGLAAAGGSHTHLYKQKQVVRLGHSNLQHGNVIE